MRPLRAFIRTAAMVVPQMLFQQIPRGPVTWRRAVALAAGCLDGGDLAKLIRGTSEAPCTKAEYGRIFELLYARPRWARWHPEKNGPYCDCEVPLDYRAALTSQEDLRNLERASLVRRYSEADLGAITQPVCCVGRWLDMSTDLLTGKRSTKRPGRSGSPKVDPFLQGRLRGLVTAIRAARESVAEDGVVSAEACAALLLFFTTEEVEPPLPAIKLMRPGVADGESLRRLADYIQDRARPPRKNKDKKKKGPRGSGGPTSAKGGSPFG